VEHRGPADGRDAAWQLPDDLPSRDRHPPVPANAQRVYNERVATPQTLRTREQVARFFAGLELVDPGLVQVHQWRPGPGDSALEGTVSAHGAVARKP
jgi:hypothetical protein